MKRTTFLKTGKLLTLPLLFAGAVLFSSCKGKTTTIESECTLVTAEAGFTLTSTAPETVLAGGPVELDPTYQWAITAQGCSSDGTTSPLVECNCNIDTSGLVGRVTADSANTLNLYCQAKGFKIDCSV